MKEGHNDIFFRLREYRRRVLVPASVGEMEHDAAHVRDDQRAHHARDEPGRFVSVCFSMHNGHRDGLLCTFQQRWSSKGKYDESGPPEMFSVRSRPINSFRMYGAELGSLTDDDIGSQGAAALTLEPHDEPGRFVSVCSKTHNGHRDGLLCTFQQRWSSKGKYDESGPPEMFSVRSRPINSLRMYGAELGSLTDDDIGSRGATALTSASLLE